ncbi:DUF6037 family protein [Acidipropionibacterium virtanenii]|uniref:Uncharacterized protein n=1 Tax=Acidipropionibacterium virtanenii TaxID=2057246 RepID=A0A344UUR1_9ACTN|nr:DUF6037 family protein [Acidipropionibacterium virtanenii]AXE39009.1 hypothetical protein JS278_01851 [Acidipropionibacterium virtanenii]
MAGYTSADKALDLLERTYGPQKLLTRHCYLTEDLLKSAPRPHLNGAQSRKKEYHSHPGEPAMTDLPQITDALNRTRAAGGQRVLYRFTLTVGATRHEFDSLLTAENDPPHDLLIAHVGTSGWSAIYQVDQGPRGMLWASALLDRSTYKALLAVLGIGHSGNRPWPTSELLQAADAGAIHAKVRAWVPPHEIPRTMRNEVEEADKTAFIGWIDWQDDRLHRRPTASNLQKTSRLLGSDIAAFCKERGISSRWADPASLTRDRRSGRRPTPPGFQRRP